MRFRIITSTGLVIIWLLSSFTLKHRPRVLSFDDFESHLHFSNDTTYLVNFWASWCTPCVDELPAIEQIGQEYGKSRLRILLVSLDFPKQIESRLVTFIEKNGIHSEVLVLNDPDANKWIDKVDSGWSGSIPAILIYNQDRIIELDNKYKSMGYPVIAINPNNTDMKPDDDLDAMKKRAEKKGYTFPYLKDADYEVFEEYGATRTPHIYVLTKKADGLVVTYIGAIDDNYQDASDVEEAYLANAPDALLADKEPEPSFTKVIGCSIKQK